jgi:uncharacterized protein (DUF983 family)
MTATVSPTRAFVRGAVKRCPRCGRGHLFRGWFTMLDRCPRCGLAFERSDGFWLGAMAVNLGVTEATFGIFVVLTMWATWPDVPWAALTVAALVLNLTIPILFYPFSKTIFLAFDLAMHQTDAGPAPELERNEPPSGEPPSERRPRAS